MKKNIVAIDQSTSATKAFLIDHQGTIVQRASLSHKQYYPASGHVEHDAEEIYQNVVSTFNAVTGGISASEIAALALTNQRETVVVWDRATGRPVAPAIVWQDVRGEAVCQALEQHKDYIHQVTGLPLSPYFAASKLAALFAEQPTLKQRADRGELCVGTIDSYLIYRLTNGRHITDYTNASRTQLLDINTLSWSEELCDFFGIPVSILPGQIAPCDASFGSYQGIPITGVLGDSHAALYGQGCHVPGTAKATYGTGSSIMMNIGTAPLLSNHGLSTSIGFSAQGKTNYALEGNITSCGDTLRWLCDDLKLFRNPAEIEALAIAASTSDGVSLVPAFNGLGTPYFDSRARTLLSGMNRGTKKEHIAHAALASIAHQDTDVLEIMNEESGYPLHTLHVDGGPTQNAYLMQMQADYANCTICCSADSELSALGAAYMAGIAVGLYAAFEKIPALQKPLTTYAPQMSVLTRVYCRSQWKEAVQRARSNG